MLHKLLPPYQHLSYLSIGVLGLVLLGTVVFLLNSRAITAWEQFTWEETSPFNDSLRLTRSHARDGQTHQEASQQGGSLVAQHHDPKDEIRDQVKNYLIAYPIPIPKDYEPFQVGDDNNIDLRGDWALFNLMSVPIEEKQEEYGSSPNILLGVAHKENEEWEVYIESTPRYLSILDSLPEWLQWLAERRSSL